MMLSMIGQFQAAACWFMRSETLSWGRRVQVTSSGHRAVHVTAICVVRHAASRWVAESFSLAVPLDLLSSAHVPSCHPRENLSRPMHFVGCGGWLWWRNYGCRRQLSVFITCCADRGRKAISGCDLQHWHRNSVQTNRTDRNVASRNSLPQYDGLHSNSDDTINGI